MSQTPTSDETHNALHTPDESGPLWSPKAHRRLILGAIGVLCLVLLVVVPPLISVNRFQRRVAVAISGALGRPVHFDRISLHLLPIPGLTIENFVVSESPEFGAEPVLRANTVEARLRVGSLWRRRVEVSQINLLAPSINLVRRPDGRWNLQGILMQASQMDSAPTAQTRAGDAPRFPYIEATEARINFKEGIDKLPFSVRESEFALWLPEPGEWRLRLSGRPVRTDTNVSDVGLLRVEATLGRAVEMSVAPIDLSASWKPTPLGEAGKLTVGYDTGWRGEVSAQATLRGTMGHAKLVTDVHLLGLRRADFVPEHTAEVHAHCEASASGLLRSLHDVRCAVPTSNDTSIFSVIDSLRRLPDPMGAADVPDSSSRPGVLLLRGEVPNVLDWRSITGTASLTDGSAGYALAWARLFSRRIPRDFSLGGTFNLTATVRQGGSPTVWDGLLQCDCVLPTARPVVAPAPVAQTDTTAVEGMAKAENITPVPGATAPGPNSWSITVRHNDADATTPASALAVLAYPKPASLPGKEAQALPMIPAGQVISGQISETGYTLMFASDAAAREAAAWLPPLGDAMPADPAGALKSDRVWGSLPIWTATPVAAPHRLELRRRRR